MDTKKWLTDNKGNVVLNGVMVFIVSTVLLYVGLTIVAGVLSATTFAAVDENSTFTAARMYAAQGNLTSGVGQGFNLMSLSPLVIGASVILGALFAGLYVKGAM